MILGLDGATWTVLDPMRRRGLMPNLDALLARSAHGTLRSIDPARDHGRLDDDDDRLRPGRGTASSTTATTTRPPAR